MAEERTWDAANKRYMTRTVKSGDDVANAVATAKMQDASGLGSKEKKAKRPPPKQADYPDMATYGAAVRKWRLDDEADPDSQARSRALSKMRRP